MALFLVLIYGSAALASVFGSAFGSLERTWLALFLVLFPVFAVVVLVWLFVCHEPKLFFPANIQEESNNTKALAVTATSASTSMAVKIRASDEPSNDGWKKRILWVDDRPENNTHPRQAFEALGLDILLSLSTTDALYQISRQKFSVVISDMGRKEGPREGYVLLDKMREDGNLTPLFFYAGSNAPEHKAETARHGGQGCTNNPSELYQMVVKAVINS